MGHNLATKHKDMLTVNGTYGSAGKESAHNKETLIQSLGREDPLEKGKATHSSMLAWRIPWTV